MLRFIHIATPDRIMMNILNLLVHHLLILDPLRMHPFLPELVWPVSFVLELVKSQLTKNKFVMACDVVVDAFSSGEGLEIGD
jgi:hypothetical protein